MRAQLRRDFQGRRKVETFPGTRVQAMREGVQLALRVARPVRALGQVLAQQPVRVFIGPARPRAVRIGTKIWIASRWAHCACSALSFPRSSVKVFRSRAGTCRSFLVKPARALVASVPSTRAKMTKRVVRSTKVPTADPLRAPLMRSPSQWPGTVRVATSAGRSSIGVMLGIWPRRSVPRARGRRAGRRVTTYTAPHRWSRSRAVCTCRQDTRVGGVQQSVQTSSPASAVSGHTATARHPGVCAIAAADRPGLPPVSAPRRPDRVGPASWCGHIYGSGKFQDRCRVCLSS